MTEYQLDLSMLEIAAYMRPNDEFLVSVSLKSGTSLTGQLHRMKYNCARLDLFKAHVGKKITYKRSECDHFAFIDIEQIAAVTAVNTDGVAA